MCSIYGSIGKNYHNIEKLFSKELHHRGPDDSGIFIDENIKLILGHTRLSIIDLSSHAHQPMVDESDNFVLVFNGEIYNYQELKKELEALGHSFSTHSDTEVVLKSYIQWKEISLSKFRGMFAFAIYDKSKEELFLARDRFGIKPLIYTFENDQFIFSSELKPFLKSNLITKKLDIDSVSDFFKYGAVKQPKTMLKGVFHLMPGHFMWVDKDLNKKEEKYYNLTNEASKLPVIESYDKAIIAVRKELECATKYHMVADVEVGAFLSGGVDSTAVVALMKKYSKSQINTFSIGFKNKTDVVDETEIAARTAKQLHTNHHDIKIDDEYVVNIFEDFIESLDQPSIDGINTYIVSRETSKEMKVALSGLGGDEIFAGYSHFAVISKYANKKKNLITLCGKALNKIRPNRYTNYFQYIGTEEEQALNYLRKVNKDLGKTLKTHRANNKLSLYKNLSSIQKISKAEIDDYMLNTLLRDNDVLSMAHSLEVRPILLDHKLTELAFSLDDSFKVRSGQLKSVFVDAVKDIIPGEVWQRRKTGFEMPFASWMNGGLNDMFKRVIESEKAKRLFTEQYYSQLKKRVKNRSLNRSDWISFIFLNWLERYDLDL
jgi:asparagine synthase (glutamine-hydrolysing)